MHRTIIAFAPLVALLCAPAARAQEASTAGGDAGLKALEEQIARELGQGKGQEAAPPEPASTPSAGGTGANPYARLLAMPDLSAIGSFAAVWNDYDVGALSPRAGPYGPPGKPEFQFEELELGLQSVVDPYARADLFISIGPEGAAVEEGYLTTLSLPGGLQARAGQLFAPFGRSNGQHPHSWDFVDAPLARSRVLAEEVLSGPGLDVSWLAPLPWFAELHVAAQSTSPTALDGPRMTAVARLLQYLPLTDQATLGVGLSGGWRDEAGDGSRELAGVDLHLRWRPLDSRASVTLQGELYGRRFTAPGGGEDWGVYGQLFWRAGPFAGLGVRYDQAPGEGGAGFERRYTAVGTWYLSEFQRLRLQLTQDERPDGGSGFEALLHVEFGIGAHGAHPF